MAPERTIAFAPYWKAAAVRDPQAHAWAPHAAVLTDAAQTIVLGRL
jgi:hypothetical protein